MISARTMGGIPYPGRSLREMLASVSLDLFIQALTQEVDDGALEAAVHGGPDRVVEARNDGLARLFLQGQHRPAVLLVETDRKSTRLNSSHLVISYAVFCLKKKKD